MNENKNKIKQQKKKKQTTKKSIFDSYSKYQDGLILNFYLLPIP